MPAEHKVNFSVPLREPYFIASASHILDGLKFSKIRVSQDLHEIIASKHERIPAGRHTFQENYDAILTWSAGSASSLITGELKTSDPRSRFNVKGCEDLCKAFLDRLTEIAERIKDIADQPSDRFGSARWATIEDWKENDFLTNDVEPNRFLLTHFNDKYLTVPPEITDAHAAVIGPSGRGKSTAFFIPNIIRRVGTSAIVTEATNSERQQADIFKRTAGFRESVGDKIYWFNPTLRNSTRINPLDVVTYAPPDRRKVEAQKLAELISKNSPASDHWDRSSYLLLIALLLQVAEGISDPKHKHIGTVRTLLRAGPDRLAEIIANSPSRSAREEYELFYNNSTKNGKADGHAKGVVSTLLPKLMSWVSDDVITLTSKTDVTLAELCRKRFTFYLSVPTRRNDLKPLMAMIFNYLLGIIEVRRDIGNPLPLTLLLDEFTNFGAIPAFTNIYTTVRKEKIPFVIGFQSYAQLRNVYGVNDAKIIMDNTTTQIYFRPSPDIQEARTQAESLAKAIGKKTMIDLSISPSGHITKREYGRYLITTQEILKLKRQAIVFSEGKCTSLPPMLIDVIDPAQYEPAGKFNIKEKLEHHIDPDIQFPLPPLPSNSTSGAPKQSIAQAQPDFQTELDYLQHALATIGISRDLDSNKGITQTLISEVERTKAKSQEPDFDFKPAPDDDLDIDFL